MRQYPSVHTFESLSQISRHCSSSRDGKTWYPARPMGFCSIGNRLRCAWMVFTGKADAFVWPDGQ
jgi:hypothetical protein